MYCLCVYVYCTSATVCQPNCSKQIYHIISYLMEGLLWLRVLLDARSGIRTIFSRDITGISKTNPSRDMNV